jgi:hypothetical protein
VSPVGKPADFLQQRNLISDSLGAEFAELELVTELDEIALCLALSSAGRSFSLLICEISRLNRYGYIFCSYAFFRCLNSTSLSS